MKHLKKFNNIDLLDNYKQSNNYITPNILYNIQTKNLDYNKKLYRYLEYIESSGSNYITLENLNNYAEYGTNATIKFKINMIGPGIDNHNQALVLCPNNGGKFFIDRGINNYIGKLRVGLGSTSTNDREYFQNNTDVVYSFNTIISSLNNQMYLFWGGPSMKRFSYAQIYYLQLYKDNELTLDIVPVYNLITKEYGVLDKVRNKFYGFEEYTN